MADKNSEYEFEETMVTLTDEDGVEKDFYIDEIYEVNDKILLKVHFDYIKQHSVIAFPTPIFLRNLVENKFISYKITSKHYPDIVNGEIELRVRA